MNHPRGIPDLTGVRVLLVEDHDDTREVYGIYLTLCGADVVSADSAQRAVELLDATAPAVVVSDLMLGDDSTALAAKVRERGLPAIAVTGLSQDAPGVKAVMEAFSVVLMKPVLPEDLCEAIDKLRHNK